MSLIIRDVQDEKYAKLMNDNLVAGGSVLEIGDCSYSFIIAENNDNKTLVSVVFSEKTLLDCEAQIVKAAISNIYLVYVESGGAFQKAITELYTDYKVLFGSVWLSDCPSMRDFLLPHEINELLVRLFSLSYNVFIPKRKFKKVFPFSKVISEQAVAEICNKGHIACNTVLNTNASSTEMTYHVEILSVRRYFPGNLCRNWIHHAKCFLEYGLITNDITLHAESSHTNIKISDLRKFVSLKTLLAFGLTVYTKEQIFTKLLKLPPAPVNGSWSVFFFGPKIKIHTEENKLFLSNHSKNNAMNGKFTDDEGKLKPSENAISVREPWSFKEKQKTVKTINIAHHLEDIVSRRHLLNLSDEEQELKWAMEDLQKYSHFSTSLKMIPTNEKIFEDNDNNYQNNTPFLPTGVSMHYFQDQTEAMENTEATENELYSVLWEATKQYFPADKNEYINFLTIGGEKSSMMGSKIATLYHRASVLSLCSTCAKSEKLRLREIVSSMPTENQLLSFEKIDSQTVEMVHSMPEMFKYQSMLRMSLHVVNAVAKIDIMKQEYTYHNMSLVKVRLVSVKRKITSICMPDLSTVEFNGSVTAVQLNTNKSYHFVRITKYGISLKLLKSIALPITERSLLFQKYLTLDIRNEMCPENIMWYNCSLVHNNLSSGHYTEQVQELTELSESVLYQTLQKELHGTSFSFVFYNTRYDKLVARLAESYGNSTFVALKNEYEEAKSLYTKTSHLNNVAVNNIFLSPFIISSLLRSPEMFRYQFIDMDELLELVKSYNRDMFKKLLTGILASSVTTFIQFPSSKILSLALTTMGDRRVMQGKANRREMFDSDNHPSSLYKSLEEQFLKLETGGQVNLNVTRELVSPGSHIPWTLIRFDIKHLTHVVNHHFLSERDGHLTKYVQHCVSDNKTSYEVHLVRETDNFKIPYGTLQGISLAALLRMGLLQALKDKFYGQFLFLPLYEDMAPWNIVFQAGTMVYIDYDSKNRTYDELVPYANQIYHLLVNFERTVQEFDKCGNTAVSKFGFDIGSSCVKSDTKVECTDPRYPVPCGDDTCRTTYIDCLRVMNSIEMHDAKNSES